MSCFIPAQIPVFTEDFPTDLSYLILFCGQEIFLTEQGIPELKQVKPHLPGMQADSFLLVGTLNGCTCRAAEIHDKADTAAMEGWIPFRIATGVLTEGSFAAVCRARELLHWRRQHKFCGHCGGILSEPERDAALTCSRCGELYYPQLAPAVIVAVIRDGKEILLAHNRRFRENVYGLIAGFIEAGESAEQAIAREIQEETGITVGNIRYFSSQCWPFPNSLMLGYFADYVSGKAEADGEELRDLGWFAPDALPQIPPPGSIARRMIDHFTAGKMQNHE